ncbi:MAG: hypothetical protein IJ268_00195, partial [Proteobacteria bacterium]|nr:hypothetical protein [Pseudomonadota bacterium]
CDQRTIEATGTSCPCDQRTIEMPGTVCPCDQRAIEVTGTACPCDQRTIINGLAIIQPSAELNALVDGLNAIIQAKKTSLKLRKSVKKSAAEVAAETIDIEP